MGSGVIESFDEEHSYLSNFWYCRVSLGGMTFPTVENAFQAAKTLDLAARQPFTQCRPGHAKGLGRRVVLRPDWDMVRIEVMRDLLAQKFAFGSALAELLVGTGQAELIEGNDWGDRFWGVCRGTGENQLGRLLMERRRILAQFL